MIHVFAGKAFASNVFVNKCMRVHMNRGHVKALSQFLTNVV